MAPKIALFLALGLLLAVVAHGCDSYDCSSPVVPNPPPLPQSHGRCDTLKLSVCANVLDLIKVSLPRPQPECCPLLEGLVDLDAALCLCTAIRVNVINIVDLNVSVGVKLILNKCGKFCPEDFTCPPY